MTSKWSMIMFLIVIAMVAATLHSSTAQRTHVVGDALGWTIPTGGAVAYTTWASQQTFTQGDILVFNFTTGRHTVAEVSKTSYDACNITQSPISIATNGPANITLNSTGEHFYICTVPTHCGLGMQLAINVSAAANTTTPTTSSPAPAPSPSRTPVAANTTAPSPQPTPSSPTPAPSPSRTPAPAPSPSRTPASYEVGDALGWTFPPAGDLTAYATWASNKDFFVGDTLVFNFTNGVHNVATLTSKADFESCTTSSASNTLTTSPARISLTTPGEHFYVCTFPTHCGLGMQLAVNVSSSTTSSPTSNSTANPPPSGGSVVPPSPSPASKVVVAAAMPITLLLSIAFTLLY